MLALAALCLPCQTASGWGREGHKIIARIAAAKLTEKTKSAIAGLLNEGESIESMASWADEIRPRRPETPTWHYINIPVSKPGDWRRYCPDTGCVIEIVAKMERRLADRALSREQRREALLFLVHFVADLHQPLHVGDQGDRGGNDVPTVYRNYAGNLHGLWDTGLILGYMETDPGMAGRLTRRSGAWEYWRTRRGRPESWAWQAHGISRDVAYPNLPKDRPAQVGDAYARAAKPYVEKQLRRAGLRVAAVLNRALGN